MSKIVKQDTNGVKPLLAVGELGYDNYPSGGDIGRVFVGTGTQNIAQAKLAEVVAVDGKVDTHVGRVDNPHAVTKAQVGLSNVDNTSDVNKPVSTSTQNALDLKQNVLVSGTNIKTIEGQSIVGPGNIDLSKNDVGLSNVDNTADSAKVVDSAGKWTTSRLINGTAVDGTIDITTSQWGTSRNITIGSTAKSVNGSADTSWSLAEIGAIGTASPAFTGVPTAPTATVNTNTTQLATTAFVNAEIANDAIPRVTSINTAIPKFDGVSGAIQSSNILISSSDNFILPKASGGSLTISLVDGASNTNLILPESGTVATIVDVNNSAVLLKTIATGTATFTATTNNINLTGIGIGVEIGDVIQISGAEDVKNNSEFTIEVITDNDNIIVNQAHANKGTSKNVAVRASDTGVTVKLLAKRYNAPVGLGQGWVDLTASRVALTTYTNTTGKPIEAAIAFASTAAAECYYYVDGGMFYGSSTPNAVSGIITGSFTIPNGSTYSSNASMGTVRRWLELR